MKVGLMGCGAVASYGHLPAIMETPGLRLEAIFDPDAGRLQAARERFGVPRAYADVEEFFTCGLDAVAITSPAPCHRENVLGAARQGLPVLCEKPLAMDDAEAEEMIAVMREAGLPLYTAFCYRFSPSALKIRELVAEKAVGEVRSLRLIYNWNVHGRWQRTAGGEVVENARRVGRMLEGGPMVDCGTHQIDLARWWTGSEVARWQAAGAWVEEYDAPDHMWLHLDHANGAHTVVEISYTYCHTAREPINEFVYELIGTDGLIRYDRGLKLLEVRSSRGTEVLPFHSEKSFEGMYAEFARALTAGGSSSLPTGEDGLAATRLARSATDRLIECRR